MIRTQDEQGSSLDADQFVLSASRAAKAEAVRNADAVFIAVGTPSRRGDGHADLGHVYEATRDIAAALEG